MNKYYYAVKEGKKTKKREQLVRIKGEMKWFKHLLINYKIINKNTSFLKLSSQIVVWIEQIPIFILKKATKIRLLCSKSTV